MTRARTLGRVALAVALLAVAVLLWSKMPVKLQSWAPITERGSLGERVIGRDLIVTVHSATLTHELVFADSSGIQTVGTNGVWIVFDVSFGTRELFNRPAFELDAGGRHFTAYFGGFRSDVGPGLSERRPVAFEVPEKPSSVTLLVYNEAADRYGNKLTAPADSQIAVTADLPDAPVLPFVDLDRVGR